MPRIPNSQEAHSSNILNRTKELHTQHNRHTHYTSTSPFFPSNIIETQEASRGNWQYHPQGPRCKKRAHSYISIQARAIPRIVVSAQVHRPAQSQERYVQANGRTGRRGGGGGRREEPPLTLGAEKEREDLRPRVERGRVEVAMGTETMERVAIFALLTRVRCAFLCNLLSRIEPKGEADKVAAACRLCSCPGFEPCRRGNFGLYEAESIIRPCNAQSRSSRQ